MILYLLFLFCFSFTQGLGVVDGVLVIVEDNVILRSDIEEQVFLLAKEGGVSPQKTPLAFESLYKKVIEEQIDRLVVLSFAKKDSLILVSNEEVNNTLDQRINSFVELFGSKEALEDTMKMSINNIKGEYYKLVEEELFVEKFRFYNFNNTSISRQDVVSFFIENPDSFPAQGPTIDFSLIQHPVELGHQTKDSIYSLALSIKDSIDSGSLSFEEAAKRHSRDPGSSSFGGSLGYTTRGSLLPAYEQTAFSLNKGEVSFPVESSFGFHIIKLVDRLGEKISSKHILLSLKPGEGDLKDIVFSLENKRDLFFYDPSSFDSLALDYYRQYKNLSGHYTGFSFASLPPFLQKQVSLVENFSFSEVFKEGGFVFLLYRYQKLEPKKLSLDTDWALIEGVALAHKNYSLFQAWIKNKKKLLYIKKFF